jgi:hypothetical protein
MLRVVLVGFAILAAVGLTLLLMLRLPPRMRLPALVLEILFGVAVGSAGMGWMRTELPDEALAAMILIVVLVLGGLENRLVRGNRNGGV